MYRPGTVTAIDVMYALRRDGTDRSELLTCDPSHRTGPGQRTFLKSLFTVYIKITIAYRIYMAGGLSQLPFRVLLYAA